MAKLDYYTIRDVLGFLNRLSAGGFNNVIINESDKTKFANCIDNTVNNLVNYYTKSETYTKTEVDNKLFYKFTYKIASSLPTASIDTMFLIYLIPATREGIAQNIKKEYITVLNGTEGNYTYSWEEIGDTEIDLEPYQTKASSLTVDNTTYSTVEAILNALKVLSEATKSNVGTLAELTTTQKATIVAAINELNSSDSTKQPKTLADPITVNGELKSTVEATLGALNEVAETNKTNIGNIASLTTTATTLAGAINELDSGKVDKVSGSGLMTDELATKLAGIAEGAQVNAIEEIQVNGTPLNIESKGVNLTLDADDIAYSGTYGESTTVEDAIDDVGSDLNTHIQDTNNPHGVTASQIGLGNVDNTSDLNKPISIATLSALDQKLDKVQGKQLTTEDFTTELKNKLNAIAEGAEVNIQADWHQTTDTEDDYIKNKPNLGTASALNVAASGNASATEVVKGDDTRLTDSRDPNAHTHTLSEVTDSGSAASKEFTTYVNPGNVDLPTSNAVYLAMTSMLEGAFRPAGNKTIAELTSDLLVQANVGNVYKITDSGTTDTNWVGGAGQAIGANQMAVVVYGNEPNTFLFNLENGIDIDMNAYQTKAITPITVDGVSKVNVEDTLIALNTLAAGNKANKADKVISATNGDLAALNASGNITDSGVATTDLITKSSTTGLVKNDGTIDTTTYVSDISGKADRVASAVNGNFAGLDSNGNLIDSGNKASDFVRTSNIYKSIKVNNTGTPGSTPKYIKIENAYPPGVVNALVYNISAGYGDSAILTLSTRDDNTQHTPVLNLITRTNVARLSGLKYDNGDIYIGISAYTTATVTQIAGATIVNFSVSLIATSDLPSTVTDGIIINSANKVDKVSGATAGDIATLDANGNLVDSGVSAEVINNKFGLKSAPSEQTDFDTIIDAGSYAFTSSSYAQNAPVSSAGILLVVTSPSYYIIQIYKANVNNLMYFRSTIDRGTTWTTWKLLQGSISDPVEGNIVTMDANGNIKNSGQNISYFIPVVAKRFTTSHNRYVCIGTLPISSGIVNNVSLLISTMAASETSAEYPNRTGIINISSGNTSTGFGINGFTNIDLSSSYDKAARIIVTKDTTTNKYYIYVDSEYQYLHIRYQVLSQNNFTSVAFEDSDSVVGTEIYNSQTDTLGKILYLPSLNAKANNVTIDASGLCAHGDNLNSLESRTIMSYLNSLDSNIKFATFYVLSNATNVTDRIDTTNNYTYSCYRTGANLYTWVITAIATVDTSLVYVASFGSGSTGITWLKLVTESDITPNGTRKTTHRNYTNIGSNEVFDSNGVLTKTPIELINALKAKSYIIETSGYNLLHCTINFVNSNADKVIISDGTHSIDLVNGWIEFEGSFVSGTSTFNSEERWVMKLYNVSTCEMAIVTKRAGVDPIMKTVTMA